MSNSTLEKCYGRMAGWETLEVEGPDARDFLNRLSSANFNTLEPGSFTPATLLHSNGKILLYFKALRLSSEKYLMLVPPAESGEAAQTAHDAFERMHFRENLKITPKNGKWVYLRLLAPNTDALAGMSALGTAASRPAGQFHLAEQDLIVLNENRWATGTLTVDLGVLISSARTDAFVSELGKAGFQEAPSLDPYRVHAVDPAVPNELGPNTIPLEAGLDDAVHENKGCYPGQEVIERIRSMGQVPRRLARVQGVGAMPSRGVSIMAGDQQAGSLTSVAQNPFEEGWIGMGYVKRVFVKPETSYTIEGQSVTLNVK